MRPLQDIIIVTEVKEDGKKIVLLDGTEKDSQLFKVVMTGPGHYDFGVFVEMPVKKGDKVYMMGKAARFKDGDKEFLFMRARDVIAVV